MSQVYAVNHLNVGAERLQVLKTVRVSRPAKQQWLPIFVNENLDIQLIRGQQDSCLPLSRSYT